MTTTGYRAEDFKASRGLVALGALFSYGFGLSVVYAGTGWGLPCPFRALTGWDCPLCGGTRMGDSLLRFDLAAAFGYNPVALVCLFVLSGLGVLWTVEVLGGPRVRPPYAVGERLRRVHPTRWLTVSLVAAVCYTILRNVT